MRTSLASSGLLLHLTKYMHSRTISQHKGQAMIVFGQIGNATDLATAPLILLGTIWLSATPVMSALKILHEQRDIVFGVKELKDVTRENSHRIRRASLYNSYIPLLLGVLLFLATMTVLIYCTAGSVSLPPAYEKNRPLCYSVAVVPALMFLGFLIGGGNDVVVMRRFLAESAPVIVANTKSRVYAPEVARIPDSSESSVGSE